MLLGESSFPDPLSNVNQAQREYDAGDSGELNQGFHGGYLSDVALFMLACQDFCCIGFVSTVP
jgi:hypothetical protein